MRSYRKYHIEILIANGGHGADISAALNRVASAVGIIGLANPDDLLEVLEQVHDSHENILGITMVELEFAAYLAGMAYRRR